MHPARFYDKMERKDLAIPARLIHHVLSDWPISKVVDTAAELAGSLPLVADLKPTIGTLNVIPDGRLSAQGCHSTDCQLYIMCRLNAVQRTGTFTGLYCDSTYLTSYLHKWLRDSKERPRCTELEIRAEVAADLLVMLHLRPLVERDIVRFIEPHSCLYSGCLCRMLPDPTGSPCETWFRSMVPDPVRLQVNELSARITERLLSSCRVEISGHNSHNGRLYNVSITGAEDLLGEPCSWWLKKRPDWLKGVRVHGRVELDHERAMRSGVAERVINTHLNDVLFGLIAAKTYGIRFFTNQPLNHLFLQAAADVASGLPRQARGCTALDLQLPVLEDVRLHDIVKLRETEQDAFIAYRQKLESVLHHLTSDKPISRADLHDLQNDVIAPELRRLDARLSKERRRLLTVAGATATVSSMLITVGLAHGILPPVASSLLGLGATCAAGSISTAARALITPESVRNSDLYFLWKLTRKQRSSHR